jgi:hypothetical protein
VDTGRFQVGGARPGALGGALGRLLAGRARRPMLVVEGEVWEMKLLDIVLNMFVIP